MQSWSQAKALWLAHAPPHASCPPHASRRSSSLKHHDPPIAHKLISHLRILHDRALGISLFRLASFLALLDLRDHALEGFADVLVVARARFGEAAAQLFGEFLAVGEGDLALLGAQIGLVADDCEGDGIGALERGGFCQWLRLRIGDCWELVYLCEM